MKRADYQRVRRQKMRQGNWKPRHWKRRKKFIPKPPMRPGKKQLGACFGCRKIARQTITRLVIDQNGEFVEADLPYCGRC
jgi:hypothetical protein